MAAQNKLLAVLDDLLLHGRILAVELLHKGECLGISHYDRIGIDLQKQSDIRGMIGLHVLHDQIVRLSAAENGLEVSQPLFSEVLVNSVHDRDLLVHDDIGIVRHSERNHILSLEQVYLMIINANILDVICNLHTALL